MAVTHVWVRWTLEFGTCCYESNVNDQRGLLFYSNSMSNASRDSNGNQVGDTIGEVEKAVLFRILLASYFFCDESAYLDMLRTAQINAATSRHHKYVVPEL